VRQWLAHRPAWLEIRDVQSPADSDLTGQLHLGEAEAIELAQELRADLRIMDERRGREIAAARGLTVIGALGILRESSRRGLISNPIEVASHLRSTGFRASRPLVKRFEEQIRQLKRLRPQRQEKH
jgi:predicted nucleic acid-binding protein